MINICLTCQVTRHPHYGGDGQVLIGFSDGVLRLYYIESAITPGASLMKLMKSLRNRSDVRQWILAVNNRKDPYRLCPS